MAFDIVTLVSSVANYGHENRAPGVTVALLTLSLGAALVAIAALQRTRPSARHESRIVAASWLTVAAIALLLLAAIIALAAGPH